MSIALTMSFSVMAQNTTKDKEAKPKTEATKACSKEKCDKKAEGKACCSDKKDATKKEATADKKSCCSKEKKG